MKKFLTTALISALCISAINTTTFAKEIKQDTTPKTADTTVNYTVDTSSYVIVIPESVNLGEDLNIKCNKANTEPNKCIRVSISGLTTDGKVSLSRKLDDNNYQIKADIKQNNKALSNNTVVATFQNTVVPVDAPSIVIDNPKSPDSNDIKAGEYSGTIKFTVSYENY